MKTMRRWTGAGGLAVLVLGLIVASGCGAKTRYADPEAHNPKGDIGIASKDLIGATSEATTAMITQVDRFKIKGEPPVIAFYSIQNNTSQPINKDMFLRRIRSTMLETAPGSFRFVEESALQRIDEMRAEKRAGEVSYKELKQLLGADYILTGALDSLSEVEGRYKSNFVMMTFRLTDTESSEVVFEKAYEFKKERTDPWWK